MRKGTSRFTGSRESGAVGFCGSKTPSRPKRLKGFLAPAFGGRCGEEERRTPRNTAAYSLTSAASAARKTVRWLREASVSSRKTSVTTASEASTETARRASSATRTRLLSTR